MAQSLNLPHQFAISTLVGISVLGATLTAKPAMALTWALDAGSQTQTNLLITGQFIFDDEFAAFPMVSFSDVTVDGLVFGSSDVINIDTASGVTAIDWLDGDFNTLSLVFNSPLTPSGGTVILDDIVSTFTPFVPGVPLAIEGSVSAVPEPLTLMGAGVAIVLGGAFKRKSQQHRQ
jgi:hypothetical protein